MIASLVLTVIAAMTHPEKSRARAINVQQPSLSVQDPSVEPRKVDALSAKHSANRKPQSAVTLKGIEAEEPTASQVSLQGPSTRRPTRTAPSASTRHSRNLAEVQPRVDRAPSGPVLARDGSSEEHPFASIPTAPRPARPDERLSVRSATVKTSSSGSDRLEAQLASMQQKLDRLALADTDNEANLMERMGQMLQQFQNSSKLQQLEGQIEQLQTRSSEKSNPPVRPIDEPVEQTAPKKAEPVLRMEPNVGDAERFSLQIQDQEVGHVLEMLGQLSEMNILVGQGVSGTITANLQDVTVEQALDGILHSLGYVHQREGDFVFVMTPEDVASRHKINRKVLTKVFRPNYISVKDLQALVTPLLTEGIGVVAVTYPSEVGIASSADETGGDNMSQSDALLVRDYTEVIVEVEGVLEEMDIPPMQVVIEAMILQVQLSDDLQYGINFAMLNKRNKGLLVTGNGNVLNDSSGFPGSAGSIIPATGQFIANTAGLKYGFIQGDMTGFIEALESISDTNLIASPQLRVLNKQKAELIIGKRLGYKTSTFQSNQTIENINFLDVGTKLIIRPFIAPDGLVRLEVHPERSSGVIDQQGLPQEETTEVTTNVMVRDGSTIVIGGLIDEGVTESYSGIPLLSRLPLVGHVFRNKSEEIDRSEMIVLITPRIVREPNDAIDGATSRAEYERRANFFRDHSAAINRSNLARMHYDLAAKHFENGKFLRARSHIKLCLQQNKNDLEALRLYDLILAAQGKKTRRIIRNPFARYRSDNEIGAPDESFAVPPLPFPLSPDESAN